MTAEISALQTHDQHSLPISTSSVAVPTTASGASAAGPTSPISALSVQTTVNSTVIPDCSITDRGAAGEHNGMQYEPTTSAAQIEAELEDVPVSPAASVADSFVHVS